MNNKSMIADYWKAWNPKQPVKNECLAISNLYGWKSSNWNNHLQNGCLGFQGCITFSSQNVKPSQVGFRSKIGAPWQLFLTCSTHATKRFYFGLHGFTGVFWAYRIEHLQRSAKWFPIGPWVFFIGTPFEGACDACDFSAFRTKGASWTQLTKKKQMFQYQLWVYEDK